MDATCPRCSADVTPGSRFCAACGARQQVGCRGCGADLPPGARFCPACGTPRDEGTPPAAAEDAHAGSTPVAARRVTSVLFGDLVGFTSLAEGRDHEDVRELLSRYFETARRIVDRFGGVVEKFIGDAVMAVWGVPVAHEDDAERAVRAGLELVAAVGGLREEVGVPDLAMRVGVVTGEVAVTVGATGQGMVAGDAVNTAARVQGAARPGQVWVDAATRHLAQPAITFDAVGSHDLKGKAEPVPLWVATALVAGAGGQQRWDGLEAPLVGRERELRLVKEVFHRVGEQQSPSLVVVSGEPGVGKSRLAWEFEKYVDGLTAPTRWHEGRCIAYGERMAFHALAEAFRVRLRLAAGADEVGSDPATVLAAALPGLVPDADERDWIAPRVGALLGVGSLREFSRDDLFAAWASFLRHVGAGADTVVLLVEDAEHADEGLVAFVEYLVSTRVPVLVLLLARASLVEEHPELVRNPHTVLLNLAPLGDGDLGRLLDGLVDGLPAVARDELARRSEGVPLYAVETVRSLVDRGLVAAVGGRHRLVGDALDLSSIGAPASLQALVAARLDALGPAERRVVEAASVLGKSFHRDHLATLVGDDADLGEVLPRLQRAQLVVRETSRWSGDYGQYRFLQAVVQQVAYGTLARRDRRAAHLRAVEAFAREPDAAGELAAVIAEHLSRAAEAVPDAPDVPELRTRAIEHLTQAAGRAQSLGAIQEAAGHLEAAAALAADPGEAARLRLRRGLTLVRGFHSSEALEVLVPLVEFFDAAGDEVAAGAAAGGAAGSLFNMGRGEEAAAYALPRWEALLDRVGADEAVLELAGVLFALATSHQLGSDARVYAQATMRIAERTGDNALVARGLRHFARYYDMVGLPTLSRILGEAGLELMEDDPPGKVATLTNMAASRQVEDLTAAYAFSTRALELTRRLRLDSAWEIVLSNHSVILLLHGDWAELDRFRVEPTGIEDPVEGAVFDFVATTLALARGLVPDTPGWTPAALREAAIWHRSFGLVERVLREGVGDGARLDEAVTEVLAYAELGLTDDLAVLWPALFDVARAVGDRAATSALLGLVPSDSADHTVPLAFRAHRARALGLLARDDGDRAGAAARLREGVRLYDQWGAGPQAARTRVDLAGILLDSDNADDVAEGREALEAARAAFDALGARGWSARLELEVAR